MNEGLISKRYAKALYLYARQRHEEEALYRRMNALTATFRALPHLHKTLCSPMVPVSEKETLLCSITPDSPEESYLGFVRLTLTNHREQSLAKIALSYADYYLRQKHITVVHLTFAVEMPQEILSRIQDGFARAVHGEVELSVRTDASIVGGFILQINDRRLDASVTGQIEQMRKQILQENKYSL
jgi:F-type H+-transporting ATPase subunit delta